ncbi:MAG: hypothetical protein ACXVVK_00590 [Solirubrobacteraceae bacterium]
MLDSGDARDRRGRCGRLRLPGADRALVLAVMDMTAAPMMAVMMPRSRVMMPRSGVMMPRSGVMMPRSGVMVPSVMHDGATAMGALVGGRRARPHGGGGGENAQND